MSDETKNIFDPAIFFPLCVFTLMKRRERRGEESVCVWWGFHVKEILDLLCIFPREPRPLFFSPTVSVGMADVQGGRLLLIFVVAISVLKSGKS